MSVVCSAGAVLTPLSCALITHSTATCYPGDVPVIGRMMAGSIGRYNCSLHRKHLWSVLTSKPFQISPAETVRLPSPCISQIQIRSRGRGEPLFELATRRPD